ncbi:MAG: hypothetical protein AMXMBFR66_21490 [Pseudomonadota bacterium]
MADFQHPVPDVADENPQRPGCALPRTAQPFIGSHPGSLLVARIEAKGPDDRATIIALALRRPSRPLLSPLALNACEPR